MNKTTVSLGWDKGGRINHEISGIILPPPMNDELLGILMPSSLFFLAHQFGSMKPSHGLIACGTVMDMLLDERYVLTPINSALKGGDIDIVYLGDHIGLQFRPKQGMFANSDSVEEGVRQLINNYTHYVYNKLDEESQFTFKSLALIAIKTYFEFIEEKLRSNAIGRYQDDWSLAFPSFSSQLVAWIGRKYAIYSPPTDEQREQFALERADLLKEWRAEIGEKRRSLFLAMGLN